ncbi:hypothetical protein [Streptomyces megasporus]|uniref:hypothetical protein n=1 Tax=Streptomyces megasporus TaxID=44060 RepID=UPI00055DB8F6|nr:hypothetical protein [Streptomyces megasporus]
MSSSLRRGALAASTLALSIAALTACGAGPDAQSLNIQADNASTAVGDIEIQNVNIVTDEDGSGPASVSARIFNNGSEDERLESITIAGSGETAELSPAEGQDLTVPAGGSLALGGEGNASALIPDADQAGISDGNAQPIVFELSSTGRVEMRVTVVPETGAWAGYGPSAAPTQEARNPEPGGSESASPEASASAAENGEPGDAVEPAETE